MFQYFLFQKFTNLGNGVRILLFATIWKILLIASSAIFNQPFFRLPDIRKNTYSLIFCSNLRLFDIFIPVSSNFLQFPPILGNFHYFVVLFSIFCSNYTIFRIFASISTSFGWHRPVRQYERTNNSRTHRPNPPQIHVPNCEEKMGRGSNVSWLQRRLLDFLTYSSQSWYSKRIWCRSPPLFEIGE